MDLLIKALLYLHIGTGFASLVLFWLPIFLPKGGKGHRLVGKWYVYLMWVVVCTAAILSVKNLVIGNTNMGIFLGFISLITANPLWYGISVLRNKRTISARYRYTHLSFRTMIILSSIAMISYGISLKGGGGAVLMFIFGGLGLADIPRFIKDLRKPVEKIEWFKDHLVGMCTSGIAAYTAFFVFGANNYLQSVLSGYWGVIPWVAPTVIGITGIFLAVRYYRKKGAISSKG